MPATTSPYYANGPVTVFAGDCIQAMREMPDESIDSAVTDPPYGLEFMGKQWDRFTPLDFERWCSEWATECLRLLKPGGHLLAFGGSRTWHRLAAGIEDAGFEMRDSIAWLYGSGFPKSLDVSKAIDKAAGATREVVGHYTMPSDSDAGNAGKVIRSRTAESMFGVPAGREGTPITAAATDSAREWDGWGTALKPAFEPIVVARKPLAGTVAVNVLANGTGALNIDASRTTQGRWPANVVLDESQAASLDEQSGTSRDGVAVKRNGVTSRGVTGWGKAPVGTPDIGYGGEGGASRFFYTAKADSSERPEVDGVQHPTVKPLDLMQWLVRLVTPANGVVLEPFAGSGTTVEACIREGFSCIAIEREPSYLPLIMQRIRKPHEQALFV